MQWRVITQGGHRDKGMDQQAYILHSKGYSARVETFRQGSDQYYVTASLFEGGRQRFRVEYNTPNRFKAESMLALQREQLEKLIEDS